jgi:acyl-CoA thioesterase
MSDVAPVRFPLQEFLGMSMADGPDGAVARVDFDERHQNPNGVAHGAVLFAMVDTAMGKATMDVVDEGCYCASIEVQLRFLRPGGSGVHEAVATVVKPGRSVVHLEAKVTGPDGRLVATATGTFAVIRPG